MAGTSPAGRRRLSRAAEFDAVYRRGRSSGSRHVVAYVFPREPADRAEPRLGLSVSRKIGGAVERNRVKRLLREAFTAEANELPLAGLDVVLVARPGSHEAFESRGLAWLCEELGATLRRALDGGR